MKKQIAKLWLKALRSDKYKQGRGALHQIKRDGTESFCCLGVLCDLYNKEQKRNKRRGLTVRKLGSNEWLVGNLSSKPAFVCSYNDCDGSLPPQVIKWAGFRTANASGRFNIDDLPELIALNDGSTVKAHSFKQIADIVEANHEHL